MKKSILISSNTLAMCIKKWGPSAGVTYAFLASVPQAQQHVRKGGDLGWVVFTRAELGVETGLSEHMLRDALDDLRAVAAIKIEGAPHPDRPNVLRASWIKVL